MGGEVGYVVDDAQRLAACDSGSFDGATCHLGLMDIPHLGATLAVTHRVLRPGGWFVFVTGHPCVLVPDAVPALRDDGRPAVSVTGDFRGAIPTVGDRARCPPGRQSPPQAGHLPERG